MWLMNSISSAQVCSSGYLIVVEFVGRLADMTDAARYGLSGVCFNKNVPDGLFIVLSSRYALAVQVLGMECLFAIDSLCRRVLTDLVRCRAFMETVCGGEGGRYVCCDCRSAFRLCLCRSRKG